jgi:hypothetical protein
VFLTGRLSRVWGYEETGDCGTVTVRIEDAPYMNLVENIGIVWDEVPTFESSEAPNFVPLTLQGDAWTADIDFTGKGVFTIGVSPVLSISETENSFKLFPNPASDKVSLDVSKLENVESIEVLNALGQVVISHRVSTSLVTLDISELKSGNYFVRLLSKENVLRTEKLEVLKN